MAKFHDHVGLDIGSKSIKLIQLTPSSGNKFRLAALAEANIPTGVSEQEAELAKINTIKKLFKDSHANSKQVVIGLPESQVYTRVIEMPNLAENELAQAIHWQAEQYIPVPLADVILKHQVISKTDEEMSVLLVAAPNLLLQNYTSIVSQAGLEAMAIETEILAVARSLASLDPSTPSTLLVHMGSEGTVLAIIAKGNLALTQSVSSGGSAITRAISSSLGLDINQAEEYKKAYGLEETQLEGKVAIAVKPLIELILTEVKRVLAFYQTQEMSDPVKRVVLSGGTALMPGLVHYFTQNLNLEAQLGNPFAQVELSGQQEKTIGENGALYTTAVGLALKLT